MLYLLLGLRNFELQLFDFLDTPGLFHVDGTLDHLHNLERSLLAPLNLPDVVLKEECLTFCLASRILS